MSPPSPSDNVDATADPADVPVDPRRRPVRKRLPPEDPRPFVDRYQGTDWDNSTQTSVARRRHRSGLNWPGLIAAVAFVVALAVAGVYTMVGSRRPTGLSAFRNATPAPAQLWVVPAATVTEQPGAMACPAGASSTPQVWRAGSQHPAALFIGLMTKPDVSFHLKASVAIAMLGQAGALHYAMDTSAGDYSALMTMTSPAGDLRVQMVAKDGVYYARDGDGRWMSGQGAPPPGNPFGDVTAESYDCLEYVGQEWVDGRLLHHLRLPVFRWLGPTDRALAVVKAPPVFRWDIWVDAAGRPRSARTVIDVTLQVDGRDIAATLDFAYRLSRFGKKITIELPAPFRG